MSLFIDVDCVDKVLLAGVWYDVLDDSFDTDAYEFVVSWWNYEEKVMSTQLEDDYTGCRFETMLLGKIVTIMCSLKQIQAVVFNRRKRTKKTEAFHKLQKEEWERRGK